MNHKIFFLFAVLAVISYATAKSIDYESFESNAQLREKKNFWMPLLAKKAVILSGLLGYGLGRRNADSSSGVFADYASRPVPTEPTTSPAPSVVYEQQVVPSLQTPVSYSVPTSQIQQSLISRANRKFYYMIPVSYMPQNYVQASNDRISNVNLPNPAASPIMVEFANKYTPSNQMYKEPVVESIPEAVQQFISNPSPSVQTAAVEATSAPEQPLTVVTDNTDLAEASVAASAPSKFGPAVPAKYSEDQIAARFFSPSDLKLRFRQGKVH